MTTSLVKFLNITGLTWLVPLVRLCSGDSPSQQFKIMWLTIGVPVLAFMLFLGLWSVSASKIHTSLGAIPGPTSVWHEASGLMKEHEAERKKAAAFFERQRVRNDNKLARDPDAEVKIRPYTGKATFIDQVFTSIGTVLVGFLLASLIAIPIGILCGLSSLMYSALNPLI